MYSLTECTIFKVVRFICSNELFWLTSPSICTSSKPIFPVTKLFTNVPRMVTKKCDSKSKMAVLASNWVGRVGLIFQNYSIKSRQTWLKCSSTSLEQLHVKSPKLGNLKCKECIPSGVLLDFGAICNTRLPHWPLKIFDNLWIMKKWCYFSERCELPRFSIWLK